MFSSRRVLSLVSVSTCFILAVTKVLATSASPQQKGPKLSPADQVTYSEEKRSAFVPTGGATTAGDYAANLCHWLGNTFKENSELSVATSFSRYYPEGSNPSLELLSATYPSGLIPPKVNVAGVLVGVGPDVDITADHGYGRSSGRQGQNGPLGGLPAFCRFGASVYTSSHTEALVEVWLPLASDVSIPLANINATDFPTNSTPFEFDKDGTTLIKQPLWAGTVVPPGTKTNHTQIAPMTDSSAVQSDSTVTPVNSSSTTSQLQAARSISTSLQSRSCPDEHHHKHHKNKHHKHKHHRHKHHHKKPLHPRLTGDQVLGDGAGWNGRLLFIGNGGQRGWIPLTDMKSAMSRFRFATVSTNLGHFSNSSATNWVVGPKYEDTILDWASRATHISRLAGEEAINLFYGKDAGVRTESQVTTSVTTSKHAERETQQGVNVARSSQKLRAYMAGCSTGGKAGLASAMYHPDDFDGILAGSPAIFFNRLNRGQIKEQSVWRKEIAKEGMFNISVLPGIVHQEILKQCDAMDGLADGVINDPRKCKPDLSPLLCPNSQPSDNLTCITQPQIDNIGKLYTPTVLNDTFVYDQYFPGLEAEVGTLTGTAGKAIGWYELAILKFPKVLNNTLWNGYKNITLEIVEKGEKLNPGGSNTDIRDLSRFINAGHKLIHYHGLADITVSPAASMRFYDEVEKTVQGRLAHGGPMSDSYKLYPVPGMGHCRDGAAAWHFGGITQNDAGNRPLKFDTHHDILLSLIAWVEKGIAPHEPIAAKYGSVTANPPPNPNGQTNSSVDNGLATKYQSYQYGLDYTRKLCPYPTFPQYIGGPTEGKKAHKSFRCV